ncbi:hypothetical protein [Desulforhopalus singaporensis]|uniref:Zinc resistance-associated protein n=1 Tax=Desulforhopalus singaporensis TaxID=91360 RepID=A0A1H0LVM2_9BACT|nr:hypothetical protein [Desulforhopalus singaporensis]SDO72111.1 hypothetical protein SAMN05660330_00870 [Desulforhopalus singaporensis]
MKKIIAATILIVGLAAGAASAHNNGWFGMYGHNNGHMMGGDRYGMHNYHHGCSGATWSGGHQWSNGVNQKFMEDTVALRKALNDKRFEYGEALRDPDISRDNLARLEQDIFDLESQIRGEMQ